MDTAGQLLVNLEDLSDGAVLPVSGNRASVFELQTVLVDELVCGLQRGHELLRADDEARTTVDEYPRGSLDPATRFESMGFTEVFDFRTGIDWMGRGFPPRDRTPSGPDWSMWCGVTFRRAHSTRPWGTCGVG